MYICMISEVLYSSEVSKAKGVTRMCSLQALLSVHPFSLCLYSTVCEALSQSSCTSFQSLTIRSWIRCVLQMHVKHLSEPDLLINMNSEQAVGKCHVRHSGGTYGLNKLLSNIQNMVSYEYICIKYFCSLFFIVTLFLTTYGKYQLLQS